MALAENLNRAIVSGDIALVKSLVKDGAAMDHLLGMRGTALCAALSAGQPAIAIFLIDAGCGVNVEDYDKEPPIFLAIDKGCFDVVHRLTKHPKCNLNKYDPLTNMSPLCLAVTRNHLEVVKWFVEAGANLNVTDHMNNTSLHIATRQENYDVMNVLVNGGCDLFRYDLQGKCPIHIVAERGDILALKIILQKWIPSIDISAEKMFSLYCFQSPIHKEKVHSLLNCSTKASQSTPIRFAIDSGKPDMVKLLLRYGASANEIEDGITETPLLSAIRKCCVSCQLDTSCVLYLLKAGANPNARGKVSTKSALSEIETPVTLSSKFNNVGILKMLLSHGAELTTEYCTESENRSLLYITLRSNAVEVAWFLIKECATLDRDLDSSLFLALGELKSRDVEDFVNILVTHGCDVNGETGAYSPLSHAVLKNNIDLVRALLKHGATVNQSDEDEKCPIHYAVQVGNRDILLSLLMNGADVNINSLNHTPLDMCLEYIDEEHIDIAFLLLEAGGEITPDPWKVYDESLDFSEPDSDSSDPLSDDNDDREEELTRVIQYNQRNPATLLDICLKSIRRFFIDHNVAFCKIDSLPLPPKLTRLLSFKSLTDTVK